MAISSKLLAFLLTLTMVTSGEFTPYKTKISKSEKQVFQQAMADLTGVGYSPIAVASQVVAGMNYRFLCNAQATVPNAPNSLAVVEIYQSLDGKVEQTGIKNMLESGEVGGYTKFSKKVKGKTKKIFKKATQQLTGASYEPLAVATQVVSGLNYKFICNARTISPNPVDDLAIITVYQSLSGELEVLSVE